MKVRAILLCWSIIASAAKLAAQEAPNNASIIIARTKATPDDAYKTAVQKLVLKGYTLKLSDPSSRVASTELVPFNTTDAIQISFVVQSDSIGTFLTYRGFFRFHPDFPAAKIQNKGQSKSPFKKAWNELYALAAESADSGLEFKK